MDVRGDNEKRVSGLLFLLSLVTDPYQKMPYIHIVKYVNK